MTQQSDMYAMFAVCRLSKGCVPPQVIPCIWTGYPPPSSVMRGVMLLLYLTIGLIAVTANSLVIILWVRSVSSVSVAELQTKLREDFTFFPG